MADNQAKVTISLDDQFSGPLTQATKKADTAFGDLGKTAGNLVKGFVAFEAAKKAAEFLTFAYNAAKEAEVATAKLTAALGKQSEALKIQAEQLSKKVNIDDDAIISADAMLANYVKSESAIQTLIPAVLDLAAATGVDLNTAAMQVGRAIADDGAELGRYKIAIEGAAGSNERAQSVFEGIIGKFGDQAEAVGKAKGGVESLKIAWEDFAKGIGEKISPAIDSLAAGISKMLGGSEGETQISKKILETSKLLGIAVESNNVVMVEKHKAALDQMYKDLDALQGKTSDLFGEIGAKKTITGLGKNGLSDAEIKAKASEEKARGEAAADLANKLREEDVESARIRWEASQKIRNDEKAASDDAIKQFWVEVDEAYKANQQQIDDNSKKVETIRKQEDELKNYRINYAVNTSQMLIDTISMVAEASGANAEEMKGIRAAEAVINGAAAIVAADMKIWSSAGSWQEALAETIIVDALLIAQTAAQVATIENQKFASGGIVGGGSFSGDQVSARVNSGEMILNRSQQSQLFAMANGGGGGVSVVINASGADASTVGALNRTSRTIAREVEKAVRNGVTNRSRIGAR